MSPKVVITPKVRPKLSPILSDDFIFAWCVDNETTVKIEPVTGIATGANAQLPILVPSPVRVSSGNEGLEALILRVGLGELSSGVRFSSCRRVSIRTKASCSASSQYALRHSRRHVALNDFT